MSKEWFEIFQDELWLKAALADRTGGAEFLYEICGLGPGMTLLDAPCGAGDVSLHLARIGVEITGVDLVVDHIQRARKLFSRHGLAGRFLCQDLREMDFCEYFDAAANWFGSFGYFSEAENLQMILRYARSLKPGGQTGDRPGQPGVDSA